MVPGNSMSSLLGTPVAMLLSWFFCPKNTSNTAADDNRIISFPQIVAFIASLTCLDWSAAPCRSWKSLKVKLILNSFKSIKSETAETVWFKHGWVTDAWMMLKSEERPQTHRWRRSTEWQTLFIQDVAFMFQRPVGSLTLMLISLVFVRRARPLPAEDEDDDWSLDQSDCWCTSVYKFCSIHVV